MQNILMVTRFVAPSLQNWNETMQKSRRKFLAQLGIAAGAAPFASAFMASWGAQAEKEMFFKISLAQWSLRELLFPGKLSNLDFPTFTQEKFGIDAVEYVSVFFPEGKAKDPKYLNELNHRAKEAGVKNNLIMVDLWKYETAAASAEKRKEAAEAHYEWIDAAHALGCPTIRINANTHDKTMTYEAMLDAFADGMRKIGEYAAQENINVVLENHGGYSSNGKWVTELMQRVNMPNCGTLPDFGNNHITENEDYDPYVLVREMMPHAKAVSAKSSAFDAQGNEVRIDYLKMMQIVEDAGFNGYVGIEYGGTHEKNGITPEEGVMATKLLLEKVGAALSS